MTISAMPLKTVALIGAVCLTTGWLLAAVLTPPVASLQGLPERRPQPTAAAAPAVEAFTEQLRLRLERVPSAPVPRRNPFVFAGRARQAEPSRDAAPIAVAPSDVATPAPVGPIFALSGIAVNETPEGEVRTAVLSDGQTVHLVKLGATISGYRVVEITELSVTLADAAGTRTILRLR
jgi:hypothetical protein